jgi:hypothetical protein
MVSASVHILKTIDTKLIDTILIEYCRIFASAFGEEALKNLLSSVVLHGMG